MCNPVTTLHPDALLVKGTQDGFEFEVTDNGHGYRCGYVRIPAGHLWHGKGGDELEVNVHGGLTFAEHDADCGKGGEDSAWWLGFDCAHFMDRPDPALPSYSETWDIGHGEVRSTEYVVAECCKLAGQAAEAASGFTVVPEDLSGYE